MGLVSWLLQMAVQQLQGRAAALVTEPLEAVWRRLREEVWDRPRFRRALQQHLLAHLYPCLRRRLHQHPHLVEPGRAAGPPPRPGPAGWRPGRHIATPAPPGC